MIWAIINTFLDSIADVLYKKALSISDIKSMIFQFTGEILAIPIVIVLIFIFDFNLKLFLDPTIFGGFVVMTIFFLLGNNLWQYLYKNEKLSTLLPYFKINSFIVVILGFLFFKDASLISFLICIWAIILTTIFSIDYKDYTAPKNSFKIILHEIFKTIEYLIAIYILKNVSSVEYVILYQVYYSIVVLLIIAFQKDFKEFKKFNSHILKYRYMGYTLWFTSYFIDIFLLKEYWVIILTLFWFICSSLTIVIAYFFLKEVPEKKEIILWVLVTILAWVGYYFK